MNIKQIITGGMACAVMSSCFSMAAFAESLNGAVDEQNFSDWLRKTFFPYKAGVTVENATDDEYAADYKATFVYEDKDDRDAVKVTVSGNFQWYDSSDPVVNNFVNTGDATGAKLYDAYSYKDGMFNTGYGLNNDKQFYEMTETKDERFELTLPLPGNEYCYDYTVTYADGDKVKIQDPANPSPSNPANGHDAGHSLFYVGTSSNTTKGQEYIYANENSQKGTRQYVTYTAVDGTSQPLEIYLPYGYDSSKTYKTLYVSHGGGGQEAEWMTIGSAANIADNLIADGETEEFIMVTMDNTYFKWDYEVIAENFEKAIIPYIEANYSVSEERGDRALCGLSMGSLTTSTIMQTHPELFGYYGAFSGANTNVEITDVDLLKNDTVIYITAGNVDKGLKHAGSDGKQTVELKARLDSLGIKYGYDLKDGAHDWGVWRAELTTFIKDYLW